MISAGIGFNSKATADSIVEIVRETLRARDLAEGDLAAVATSLTKAADVRAQHAAMTLAVPLVGLPDDELEGQSARAVTSSERVQALVGVPSLAECAALAVVGRDARLLGARQANDVATCALAKGGDV